MAYSTMRMAFFADMPSSSMSPICVYMLTLCPMMMTPARVPSTAIGMLSITATGSVQLSYCAASTRRVITTANTSTKAMVVPACVSW